MFPTSVATVYMSWSQITLRALPGGHLSGAIHPVKGGFPASRPWPANACLAHLGLRGDGKPGNRGLLFLELAHTLSHPEAEVPNGALSPLSFTH